MALFGRLRVLERMFFRRVTWTQSIAAVGVCLALALARSRLDDLPVSDKEILKKANERNVD